MYSFKADARGLRLTSPRPACAPGVHNSRSATNKIGYSLPQRAPFDCFAFASSLPRDQAEGASSLFIVLIYSPVWSRLYHLHRSVSVRCCVESKILFGSFRPSRVPFTAWYPLSLLNEPARLDGVDPSSTGRRHHRCEDRRRQNDICFAWQLLSSFPFY
jgi:hypothetical protein